MEVTKFEYLLLVTLCVTLSRNASDANTVVVKTGPDYEKAVTITQASLGTVYSNRTDRTSEYHYVYRINLGNLPPRSVRLRVDIYNPVVSFRKPLRVTARFNKGTANWNVPFEMGNVRFDFVEHTLCLLEANDIGSTDIQSSQDVVIIVSTSNSNMMNFSIKLFEVMNFSSLLNQPVEVTNVGTSSPVFYYVNLNQAPKDNLLQVKVRSKDMVCAMVSVQPFTCPVSDTEETIRKEGSFQTMLNVASFTIERSKYEAGVFIVFVVLKDDQLCGNKTTPSAIRRKNFRYEISDKISQRRIYIEVILSVLTLLALGIFAVIATTCCSVYQERKTSDVSKNPEEDLDGRAVDDESKTGYCCCVKIRVKKKNEVHPMASTSRPITMMAQSTDDEEETETDNLSQNCRTIDPPRNGKKKIPKYVHELSKKGVDRDQTKLFKSMFQKSGLYMWLVLTMGIFYGIPAIQLVLNYQEKLLQSGDADVCYYNFLCSIPVLNVVDFNHIFSNIGYLFFGCLFLFLTAYKETKDKKAIQKLVDASKAKQDEEDNDEPLLLQHFGIPQHFGIFYAMGFALIFEGILSACYHVCPTNENFQFDTTFMYLIAVLCFMKIYQFRHPDVTSNAYKVFLGIALVMFLEVIGIFYEGHIFWTLSLVAYFLTVVMLTSIIYHSGSWPFKLYTFVRIFKSLWRLVTQWEFSSDYSRKRLVFIICLDSANLAFLIYGGYARPGISTYLLMIFISNLVIYTVYYTTLKIYHKEQIRPAPMFYALLCALCWVPALYFYSKSQKSTDVTAAESRNMNEECVFLDMYDNHDIWHFFSAGGLFFSFMYLLTLDDGLYQTPRDKIIIF